MRTGIKIAAALSLVPIAGLLVLGRVLEEIAKAIDGAHEDFEKQVQDEISSWFRVGGSA